MKRLKELVIPLGDAENYRQRSDKAFFNDIYFRTEFLEQLLDPKKYFLCGDKGTGKTAMAVYLHNNEYKDTKADHVFIRNTEIRELQTLRRSGRLSLPDMQLLWETTLLLRVARQVDDQVLANGWIQKYALLHGIKATLERYYEERQNPEIKVDIEILKNRDLSGKLAANDSELGVAAGTKEKKNFTHYRDLVYAVNTELKKALEKARFSKRIIVLLDGLDNRHEDTPPKEYADTLSSLGAAVWNLNADFFSSIRDSKYRPKVVLLMRPEVVEMVGLSNAPLKMRDNGVELNWLVNDEARYRESRLFKLIDHVLAMQQSPVLDGQVGTAWDGYFPYKENAIDSFVLMLRRTYHRPRDLLTYISQMQEVARDKDVFELGDFESAEVERKFSEYLLSEIRNGLELTVSKNERDLIPVFFKSFEGSKRVSYAQYSSAHSSFIRDAERRQISVVGTIFEKADVLLQILFENNILAYIEKTEKGRSYVRWFFRERTFGDPKPMVQFDEIYVVHEGLSKALDVGVRKVRYAGAPSRDGSKAQQAKAKRSHSRRGGPPGRNARNR